MALLYSYNESLTCSMCTSSGLRLKRFTVCEGIEGQVSAMARKERERVCVCVCVCVYVRQCVGH